MTTERRTKGTDPLDVHAQMVADTGRFMQSIYGSVATVNVRCSHGRVIEKKFRRSIRGLGRSV